MGKILSSPTNRLTVSFWPLGIPRLNNPALSLCLIRRV
ncbi:hypothetical protein IQE94_00880 [Synechocystis sp. PCC 7339]|nr:hypothetical protein HTZ78_08815 [Synechocystis sp. PCC 7338]UAJ72952.1 hypothetical protein IQE94_00880 [Synechocystis sp. PCC 7339]